MSDSILTAAMNRADARVDEECARLRAAGVPAESAAAVAAAARAVLARCGTPLRPEASCLPACGWRSQRLRLLAEGDERLVVVAIDPPEPGAAAPLAWTVETRAAVLSGSAPDGELPAAVAAAIGAGQGAAPRLGAPIEGGLSGPVLRLAEAAAAAAAADPGFAALAVVPAGADPAEGPCGRLRWVRRAAPRDGVDPPEDLPLPATRLLLRAALDASAILRAALTCAATAGRPAVLLSDGRATVLADGLPELGAPPGDGDWRPLGGQIRSAHERLAACGAALRLCAALVHGV